MPRIELVTTGYGRRALEELARSVDRLKQGRALAPVCVIVPSDAAGVAARRYLASRPPGVAAVTFTTVRRLAELLGAGELATSGRRPISPPLLLAALRNELVRDPGTLAPVADHPATDEALLLADRDLSGLAPATLNQLGGLYGQAGDVVRLHRAARRKLNRDWYDETDLLSAARIALADGALDSLGPLVVHLPQALPPRWRDFLAALADHVPTIVVAGVTTAAEADNEVRTTLHALGLDLGQLSFEGSPQATLHVASDPDHEVRIAVRHLVKALGDGASVSRCAVLYSSALPYHRLLTNRLDSSELTWNGPAVGSLTSTVTGRAAVGLIGLLGRRTLPRVVVFNLLSSVPARSGNERAPVAQWERIARAAGIHDGTAAQWRERLDLWAMRERARSSVRGVDEPTTIQRIDGLAWFISELSAGLDKVRRASEWMARVRALQSLLVALIGSEATRTGWPLAEQHAAYAVDAALASVANLDSVDASPSLERFTRAALHVLDVPAPRHGRLGSGVLIGPLASAVGLDLDLVIVLGADEGVLPSLPHEDALLPDEFRKRVGLPTSGDLVWRTQRELLTAAASSSGVLILCRSRGDMRQTTQRHQSRWLGTIIDVVTTIEHASFAAEMADAAAPADVGEYRLASVLRGISVSRDDVAIPRALKMMVARRSDQLTEYDGNVSSAAHLLADPTLKATAPTSLEAWVACPFDYFLTRVLRVRPVDDPALSLSMNPLDEGSLVHEFLHRFVAATLGENRGPGWNSPDDDLRFDSLFASVCNEAEQAGRQGRSVYWAYDRERIRRDLKTFIAHDSERLAIDRAHPIACELDFGNDDIPVEWALGQGRSIPFRGSIDRVDLTPFRHLIVTDYKTGNSKKYEKLNADNPHANGSRLQLPIYALAAAWAFPDQNPAPIVARYVFVSGQSEKRIVELAVTADLKTSMDTVFEVIIDAMASGLFPAKPVPTTRGGYIACSSCDPDGRGITELYRGWIAKRIDPRLAAYRSLVGDPVDEADPDALATPGYDG